jgi:hypothetical protein
MYAERFTNGPYAIQNNGDQIKITLNVALDWYLNLKFNIFIVNGGIAILWRSPLLLTHTSVVRD